MQFPPPSHHSLPLWPKYSPQHPVLKHPQSMFLTYCQRPCFTPCRTTGKIIGLLAKIIYERYLNKNSKGPHILCDYDFGLLHSHNRSLMVVVCRLVSVTCNTKDTGFILAKFVP
jgi:hypothetical protein